MHTVTLNFDPLDCVCDVAWLGFAPYTYCGYCWEVCDSALWDFEGDVGDWLVLGKDDSGEFGVSSACYLLTTPVIDDDDSAGESVSDGELAAAFEEGRAPSPESSVEAFLERARRYYYPRPIPDWLTRGLPIRPSQNYLADMGPEVPERKAAAGPVRGKKERKPVSQRPSPYGLARFRKQSKKNLRIEE